MGLAKRISAKGAVVALVTGIALSPTSAAQAGRDAAGGHGGDAELRRELSELVARPDGRPG